MITFFLLPRSLAPVTIRNIPVVIPTTIEMMPKAILTAPDPPITLYAFSFIRYTSLLLGPVLSVVFVDGFLELFVKDDLSVDRSVVKI